jgi:predicted chitinase
VPELKLQRIVGGKNGKHSRLKRATRVQNAHSNK